MRKAVPARFVRLGAHLASDVAAVVATGCVGVDDREGVDAAVSATYSPAANAANNPTAAAARLEQGLRRLAAALDADAAAEDEKNAPTSSHVAVAVMSRLVTYVQVGTILAKRTKRSGPGTEDARAVDACAVDGDAHMDADSASDPAADPAQAARVSKQLWRVAASSPPTASPALVLFQHDRTIERASVTREYTTQPRADASRASGRIAGRRSAACFRCRRPSRDRVGATTPRGRAAEFVHFRELCGGRRRSPLSSPRAIGHRRAGAPASTGPSARAPRLLNDPERTRTFSREPVATNALGVPNPSAAGPSRESAGGEEYIEQVTLNTKANAPRRL